MTPPARSSRESRLGRDAQFTPEDAADLDGSGVGADGLGGPGHSGRGRRLGMAVVALVLDPRRLLATAGPAVAFGPWKGGR